MHRTLLALAMVVGILASPLMASASHEKPEMLKGHWHLEFYGKCVNSPSTLSACEALQGPAHFPVMGVSGSQLIVKGVGDYKSDARGRYVVQFTTTITEIAPGRRAPGRCSNALVFGAVFNGTCREQGRGRGHIGPGRTGMPDFWQDETAGSWNGSPPAGFYDSTPTDTFNPACPGRYDTRRFMALFGFSHVPAGITARITLTRRS